MSSVRKLLAIFVVGLGAASAAGGQTAPQPRLALPFDLEARGSTVYVADGERHQIFRYDLGRKSLIVVAGTGRPGTSGDGGPAARARLTEPTELVLDRAGNLYFSDVNQGRVRRIGPRGIITTVARLPAAAGIDVDPTGRYLAIASIEGWVYLLDLKTRAMRKLAGDGSDVSSGDGGPAADAQLDEPHDVTYDAGGNLLIAERTGVRRVDAQTATIETMSSLPAFKIVAGPRDTLFLLTGSPNGGKITQVDAKGAVLRTIGTGKLSRHIDRVQIGRVGFLPSDVEPVGGALLISQTRPVAALRHVAAGSSAMTTLLK